MAPSETAGSWNLSGRMAMNSWESPTSSLYFLPMSVTVFPPERTAAARSRRMDRPLPFQ